MTLAIPARTPVENIKEITLTPPGQDSKPLHAKLQGIDTLTNLSFLRCEEKHSFTAVEFLSQANVSLGDLVISAGLYTGNPGRNLAMGAAYVSSELRAPTRVVRVTGGSLSMIGSIVFNADGKAIGLVTTQPYLPFQMYSQQRNQTLLLRNLEQAVSFTPVEEFARTLTNIPKEGMVRRPSWIGGILVAVPESLREAKGITTPAVMLDQVLPGTSAAKAGLKERDIIIGLAGAPISSLGNENMTASAVRQKIARMKPGETVSLTILTKTGPRDVKLNIEPMPLMPSEAPKYYEKDLGFVLREKTPFDEIKTDANAKKRGMIVLLVSKNSPAARGNLHEEDLVVAVDGTPVSSVDAVKKAMAAGLQADPPKDVVIRVARGTTTEDLTITNPNSK
jgi:S1-C subfamily serine protease